MKVASRFMKRDAGLPILTWMVVQSVFFVATGWLVRDKLVDCLKLAPNR